MNSIKREIKADLFGTSLKVGFKIWPQIIVSNIINYISIALAVGFCLIIIIGVSFGDIFSVLSGDISSTSAKEFFENILDNISQYIMATVIIGVTLVTLLLIISSWTTNLQYQFSKNKILGTNISMGQLYSDSFSNKVFKIFGFQLIIVGAILVLSLAPALLAIFNETFAIIAIGFSFIGFVFVIPYLLRFSLVTPSIAIDDFSIQEAIALSLKTISYGKAFKYFAIGILIVIVYAIIAGIISGILSVISFFGPTLGYIFEEITSYVLGAFLTSLTIAITSGLYFRVREDEHDTEGMSTEDHLILD